MSSEQPAAPAPAPASSGLVARVQNILLKPASEWDVIAGESTDVNKLYVGYVLPLAALAAICLIVGLTVFGIPTFLGWIHYSPVTAIASGVIRFVSALVGIFVLGLVIDALAPSFGSQKNAIQAHKVAAYSSTAGLLAGVFMIYPALSALGIVGLYSLVLLYFALPRVMKTPEDKRIGYFASIIGVCIGIGIVLAVIGGIIMAPLMLMGGGGAFGGAPFGQVSNGGNVQGKVNLPNGMSVDLNQAQRAAQEMQNAQNGNVKTVDPARLQALLPDSLPGGYTRSSVSNSSGGAVGMGASQAEAEYAKGDSHITLTVVSMGGMSGMASMVGAMGVQGSEENSDGYTHVQSNDGRTITEELSRGANTAKYAVLGHNGAAVSAEGSGGASMDDVHAAVNAVGVERVEALAGGT
ncbi:MAG: Yip1 family protein [Terricaulis silvestris]